MKYKMLLYDGHAVKTVLDDRIVLCDDAPKLLPHGTTIDTLVKNIIYKDPWRKKCEKLLRTCDLEEVELKFTKKI